MRGGGARPDSISQQPPRRRKGRLPGEGCVGLLRLVRPLSAGACAALPAPGASCCGGGGGGGEPGGRVRLGQARPGPPACWGCVRPRPRWAGPGRAVLPAPLGSAGGAQGRGSGALSTDCFGAAGRGGRNQPASAASPVGRGGAGRAAAKAAGAEAELSSVLYSN